MAKRRNKPSKPKLLRQSGANQIELGERVVHDPMQPGQTERVTVNVRESPLAWMASRKLINAAQENAGEELRCLYEASIIGGAQAIDYGKPKVDGGKIGDPLSEQVFAAGRKLAKLAPVLGQRGYDLLLKAVGEGMSLVDLARMWPNELGQTPAKPSEKDIWFMGRRVREALEDTAKAWGYYGAPSDILGDILGEHDTFLPEGQEWKTVYVEVKQAQAA